MKMSAVIVDACKFLIAVPSLLGGFMFGVIGFGPEGPFTADASTRIAGLCVLFGSLAAAYPFSLIKLRGWGNWIIVAISALPLGHGLYFASTRGWPNGSDVLGMTLSCFYFPILATVDLFLSSILIAKDDQQRLKHTE